VLSYNRASEGGGMAIAGSDCTIWSSTIVSNSADQGGGVLLTPEGSLGMANTIVYYNTAGTGANWLEWGGVSIAFSNCCTDPVPTVGSCVAGPPGFARVPFGTYRLMPGSPCIDAGRDLAPVNEDIDWVCRPLNGDGLLGAEWDIGAHEYASRNLDTDRDGVSDWNEAVCGSDPTNATSRFKMTIIRLNDGEYLVAMWQGRRFRYYTVQGASSLYPAGWSGVQGWEDLRGTGGEMRKQIKPTGRFTYLRTAARWGDYKLPDWDDDPYGMP